MPRRATATARAAESRRRRIGVLVPRAQQLHPQQRRGQRRGVGLRRCRSRRSASSAIPKFKGADTSIAGGVGAARYRQRDRSRSSRTTKRTERFRAAWRGPGAARSPISRSGTRPDHGLTATPTENAGDRQADCARRSRRSLASADENPVGVWVANYASQGRRRSANANVQGTARRRVEPVLLRPDAGCEPRRDRSRSRTATSGRTSASASRPAYADDAQVAVRVEEGHRPQLGVRAARRDRAEPRTRPRRSR